MLNRSYRGPSCSFAGCVIFVASILVCGCRGAEQDPTDAAAGPDTVRVMAYNIHHGEGMDELIDLERIAALILKVAPDVVTIQEVDSVVSRTNVVDQAAELGRLTGMQSTFSQFMPYQGGAYGMAILSRLPVEDFQSLRLPDGEEPRTSLNVTVKLKSGVQIRVVGIHFYMTEEERLAQARETDRLLGDEQLPTILAGDFNSFLGDSVMVFLSESWTIVEKEADNLTFPSYAPEREIDFVMFRPGARFEVVNQFLIDEPVISDHRPYVVDLVVREEQ